MRNHTSASRPLHFPGFGVKYIIIAVVFFVLPMGVSMLIGFLIGAGTCF